MQRIAPRGMKSGTQICAAPKGHPIDLRRFLIRLDHLIRYIRVLFFRAVPHALLCATGDEKCAVFRIVSACSSQIRSIRVLFFRAIPHAPAFATGNENRTQITLKPQICADFIRVNP